MAGFDRDILIRGLPDFQGAVAGIPSESVRAYLSFYHLQDLAEMAVYKVGRMKLDEVNVTVQSFAQPLGRSARGTVIVVHGYMDHMGLYQHLIFNLFQERFNVLCYDLSGHGLSDGNALAVDDFHHYATQLAELVAQLEQDLVYPLHLVGQSTGAAVVMAHQLLFSHGNLPLLGERVLLAPLVRPAMWRSIRRKYRWFKYVLKRVPRRYSNNSHDKSFMRFISERDLLQHREIPVSWVGAMLAWGEWVENHPPVRGKIHMIQGTDDGTVDWHHNMAELGRLYPELELKLIKQAKHHLVNESPEYRDQVFNHLCQVFDNWENENGLP